MRVHMQEVNPHLTELTRWKYKVMRDIAENRAKRLDGYRLYQYPDPFDIPWSRALSDARNSVVVHSTCLGPRLQLCFGS